MPEKTVSVVGTTGYKALKGIWSLLDSGPYEDALELLFATAEVLWHLIDTDVPEWWGVGHGSVCTEVPEIWPISEFADLYEDDNITKEDLLTFGTVMARYLKILTKAGKVPIDWQG